MYNNRVWRKFITIIDGDDFIMCEECTKCWLNYIEDCRGMEIFVEENCKKRKLVKKSESNFEPDKCIDES
jgi:hypothetical protein